MHYRTLLIVVALFLSTLGVAKSQTTNFTIKGILVDSTTNEAIPYATVKISQKATPKKPIKAVPTDDNGKFSLSINQPGDYILSAIFIGKKDYTKEISLGSQKNIELGKIVMADNSTLLSSVTVSAARPIVQVDLDKITYSMEDDPDAQANNVLEMLKKVPMITVDGEENIQLKGSSSFKIYMNGKPSNMITNNPKDVLRSMPANTVKNIEVITDPGAKYDAEGVAGIINIITQRQTSMDGFTGTVNARAGSYDSYGGGIYAMAKYGKFGFTGNYNISKYGGTPTKSNSYREIYESINSRFLTQRGTSKNKGLSQFGTGELSFEIDTLNLINVTFDRYNSDIKNRSSSLSETLSADNVKTQSYNNFGSGKTTWGQTMIGADYQRTFNKKDQLLTSSYRYSYNPNNSNSTNMYKGIINYPDSTMRQHSDASMKEHTMQIDFTTPFGKMGKQHALEVGVKYIIRLNNSNSGYDYMDMLDNEWIALPPKAENDFKHRQDIVSAYSGYSFKLDKWGFKAGLRYEATWLKAEFPIDTQRNFDANYSNAVPSATVTYQLRPTQTLRAGYNMRIWRPSIWQLNPYENTSNPMYISQGNPNLDAEKSHNLNLNYTYFNPKFNMNANLSYRFSNNGIQSITDIIDYGDYKDVSYTTYYNIARNRNLNLSLYANWSPNPKFKIYTNLSGGYISNRTVGHDKKLSNSGFRANIYLGGQYTLPWDINFSVNGGYFGPSPQLQGKGTTYRYHSFSIQKNFMNKKLTVRAFMSNPFKTSMTIKRTVEDPSFYSLNEFESRQRNFGVNVSFKFGELKARIKKVARGIHNDDTNGGGGGSQAGQGGESGGGGQ